MSEFTKQEFFDWLGQWHRLSDWQLRTVLAVAAVKADEGKPEAVRADNAVKAAKNIVRKDSYTADQMRQMAAYIGSEHGYTPREKQSIRRTFASEFGRSEKAIDIQLSNIRKAKRQTK